MSLFPAYAEQDDKSSQEAGPTRWLQNASFNLRQEEIEKVTKQKAPDEPMVVSSGSSSSAEEVEMPSKSSEKDSDDERKAKKKAKKKKKKHKKKLKKEMQMEEFKQAVPEMVLNGSEEFYEDNKAILSYRNAETLYRPACPKYYVSFKRKLGKPYKPSKEKTKRYYKEVFEKEPEVVVNALPETEYLAEQGQFNRKLLESPNDLQVWLDYIKLQDRNPYKWPRLYVAEKKMDLVERALKYHPSNEKLYRVYIEAISDTFPAFEVAKLLDRVIVKDPYNYVLWTAQIMTTQGSMARCVVPEVLKIYERCMQKMHYAQKREKMGEDSDWVMLKLFNNCALFLRQAGLYEQFFALIKLALELNVSTELFGNFAPRDEDQNCLIEYEEVILQSGLPMTEIWLRIEKLRQGFNFLPMPENCKCSDPQRIVFNEDVCHYIYPLKSRENSFFLMLLVLRLLKIPFIQSDVLADKFCARVEHIGDSDAIEDMLSICLRRTFALPLKEQNQFLSCLLDVAKEMASTPSFLSNVIGHEIYVRTLNEMLLNCSEAFSGINERKRIVFLTLWCQFQRLLLVLCKLQGKLTPEYAKAMRSRFKNLLKQKANRNVLNLFTEFAICEYEALDVEKDSLESVSNIFENLIEAHCKNESLTSDLSHLYLTYAEILIGANEKEKALQVLIAFATETDLKNKESLSNTRKLVALQKLKDKLENLMAIEQNVQIMVLEQYLLPDYITSLVKLYTLMMSLMGQKAEALEYLAKLLKTFLPSQNERHNFLREKFTEIEVIILQLPVQSTVITHLILNKKIISALSEYPKNLFFLQSCGMLTSMPSYQLKGAMLSSSDPTVQAVTFFIASHRLRFIQNRSQSLFASGDLLKLDMQHNETIVRYRILNMFRDLTQRINKATSSSTKDKCNALRRNPLFWRFYLRCLSDKQTAFDTSKNCLLMALDECPWSKALYLDGATFVPQELPHLQDLIIEKQLRIYALPEELEILREK